MDRTVLGVAEQIEDIAPLIEKEKSGLDQDVRLITPSVKECCGEPVDLIVLQKRAMLFLKLRVITA